MAISRADLQQHLEQHKIDDPDKETSVSAEYDSYLAGACDPRYFQRLILDSDNRLGFPNSGGGWGIGLCWWHSRFQRSATYLTTYRADLAKPSHAEAARIVGRIRHHEGVTIIPGFRNLREFSLAHMDLINSELSRWQITDSLLRFTWLKGIFGKNSNKFDAKDYEQNLAKVHAYVAKGQIAYTMLQIPGWDAHAWLIPSIETTQAGYKFIAVDSNYLWLMEFEYKRGNDYLTWDIFKQKEAFYLQFKSGPQACLTKVAKFLKSAR